MPARTVVHTAAQPARPGARGREVGAPTGDDQLAARLRVAVTRLNRRLRQESMTGVSPSQEAALAAVKRLGRPTLGELAQAEQVQPPSMTRVVAAMEAAGLIARSGDEGDRRVSRVELTSQGRATLERIRSLKTAYLARQIALLSPDDREDAERLAYLLERLVEGQ
jgi:DNA-binding MarR family transcriptional regulator